MTLGRLLIHVGYHKTGTTWMQRRLFLPAQGYRQVCGHDTIFEQITRPHRLTFNAETAREALFGAAREVANGHVPVVSSEILSGHPFWGGRDSVDFANRIAEIAPEASILITVREQISMIASVYMQYVRRGGRLPPAEFFAGSQFLGFDGFDPSHFEFHRLVGHYRAVFSADRVKVMTQETLVRDPENFMAEIANFSGATPGAQLPSHQREGASESELAVPFLRRINYFIRDGANPAPVFDLGPVSSLAYRSVGWMLRRPGIKKRLRGRPVTDLARSTFADRFSDSNRALSDFYPGLDLTGYQA